MSARFAVLFLATAALSTGLTPQARAQDDRPFARYPAVSPDGQTVAFSYQGDLFTVPVTGGRALRLTIHPAYEAYPRFSPDGSQIAFVSDRYGNDDIFVMGADGSSPRRLTYHSTDDDLGGWTPDGRLLFQTRRTYVQVEREREFYEVSTRGGTPNRVLDAVGSEPRMSPDGRFIAFVFGTDPEFRKGYHGSANRNIWLYDTEARSYAQLTKFDGNDFLPVWGGTRALYFVSERDGTYNLYRLGLGDDGAAIGDPEQLTHFRDDGVRTFDVSSDGGTIVMEHGTDLYVLGSGASEPRRLDIRIPDDDRLDPMERKTFARDADEYAVSPNGDYIAFVVRGEVFLTENDDKATRTVRLTHSPYRDRDVAWLDDHSLIFASDRDGNYDLYRLQSGDPDQPDLFLSLRQQVTRLTNTPEDERVPTMAPDGKHVAYTRGGGRLVVAELVDGQLRGGKTLQEGWAEPQGIAWSPDSRWLAYSKPDLDFNAEVYIQAADGSQGPVNVSQHPKYDGSPVWSADGSKLGFISARNNGDNDIWFVWLRKADWDRTKQDWELLEEKRATDTTKATRAAAGPVEIDFDRMWERLEQVTSLPGDESDLAISKDGKTFYFVTNRSGFRRTYEADQDLYSVKWDGTEMKPVTSGGQAPSAVRLGPDGKRLFMMKRGGTLARVDVSGGKLETIPFSARMEIDHPAEQREVFAEAWRLMDQRFYDPNFHGHDWQALGEKYGAWAAKTSTKRDFRDVFNMMLGELNASHVGFRSPDRVETQHEQTGLLGVEIDPVADGVRVARVVPNAPADREASQLRAGDVITAVDGTSLKPDLNFYSLLTDRANERTVLSVKGADGSARNVVIRPTESLRSELYGEWVRDRRKLTDKYSNGRLGYVHVQAMNWPSFEGFERELVAAGSGKDGLVIDVRFNGGGWTTDYLMAVLTVRQHAYTIPRGAADNLQKEHTQFRSHYPFGERLPVAAWTKPSVALCNSSSYSNAEIFSHAYKTLGLGTLVGEPTFGAVISTGGAGLIDGSFVRLPFRGWYVKATDENMEHGPAVPDIIITSRPDDRASGEDAQLRAAVESLLGKIDRAAATGSGQ